MLRLLPRALFALLLSTAVACGDDGSGSGGSGGATGAATTGATATATGTAASGSGAGGDAATSSGSSATTSTTTTGPSTVGSGSGGAGGGSSSGSGGQGGSGQGGGGAGAPIDGYGDLAGRCGTIDAEDVEAPAPSVVSNAIDFTGEPPITVDDTSALTPGGQAMVEAGNLGGSSLWSEVFAFEVLARCEGAELLKTEGEIDYAIDGKKTDILVTVDGLKVGVSVVRAVGFPPEDPYTVDDALPVLEGKLDDILESSANVAPADAWEKQILAVIAYSEEHAASMLEAYDLLDDATRADTILMVTTTFGDDDFVYFGM